MHCVTGCHIFQQVEGASGDTEEEDDDNGSDVSMSGETISNFVKWWTHVLSAVCYLVPILFDLI